MEKKFGYHIECPKDKTHKFNYVAIFEEDDKNSGPRSFEVECPFCGQFMTLKVKTGMKLPKNTVLKGIPK